MLAVPHLLSHPVTSRSSAELLSLSAAAYWSHQDGEARRIAEAPSEVAATQEVDVSLAAASARSLLKEEIARKPEEIARKPGPLSDISSFVAEGDLLSALSASHVTLLGAVVNVALAFLKLAVGTLCGSAALLADAYHSISDIAVDAATMLAVHGSPAFERGCTLTIAALLSSAGAVMMADAIGTMRAAAMAAAAPPAAAGAFAPFFVALVAIASKESLFRVTRQVALRVRSTVLLASAKHHRSDALSSLAAALGTCGVLVGLPMADAVAAATVGAMLVYMGVAIARGDHD